jgi:hypothetical protein
MKLKDSQVTFFGISFYFNLIIIQEIEPKNRKFFTLLAAEFDLLEITHYLQDLKLLCKKSLFKKEHIFLVRKSLLKKVYA